MKILGAFGWVIVTAAAILTFVACLFVTTVAVIHVVLNVMGSE